ncbi:Cys-tRNA(Pro) deacylase [Mesobacillus zeae]|uniref:Cys-tRNA(Pro)/Cys-tRNA(Cys) deacylase n=2 Tax=Mesobacillus zeae TaxID=1917180 RepID=A0A398BGP8_9BACI|nr:Cys-tRNA(Pro) deacylase [Mesobacillus zeae]RID86810.1 Cys-tRNA(Pro) deacylase [Mesobacillus zeae]
MMAVKTNAMRLLDQQSISYELLTYDNRDGKIDGISVAAKIGRPAEIVFKTLVATGTSKNIYVFIIPVQAELDLKKAAQAAGEKKVEMLPVKDIQKYTGYVRGGCSPLGMKKHYLTFIDDSAEQLEKMVVSAGKIGLQIEVVPAELLKAAQAEYAELKK